MVCLGYHPLANVPLFLKIHVIGTMWCGVTEVSVNLTLAEIGPTR